MKNVLFAAILLIGCGESDPAGPGSGGAGGSEMAGASGSAGAGGGAGATVANGGTGAPAGGSSGGTATGGTTGALSCAIPPETVSGTAPTTITSSMPGMSACAPIMVNIQIISGTYYDAAWSRTNYITHQASPTSCDVTFTFSKMTTNCGTQRMLVTLTVPAI